MPVHAHRLIAIVALLLAGNACAWLAAWVVLGPDPALFGLATLAYGLGLRHAMDPDHIAAIDNVTRQFVQRGRRTVTVGLYFSLGHSTVVALACAVIALSALDLHGQIASLPPMVELVGRSISPLLLFVIALASLGALRSKSRAHRSCGDCGPPRGLLGRILRPLCALIRQPWQTYGLGFLFGLGFDTATEVGLLGISMSASHHMPPWTILVFPALFTAGMASVDTLQGMLASGVYGSFGIATRHRRRYEIAVALYSIGAALTVAGLEGLNLIGERLALTGIVWRRIAELNDRLGVLGLLIPLTLFGFWLLFASVRRGKRWGIPAR